MEAYDVVIIGAGHNALVCAGYLLKAGYSVLLLEGRSLPGGGSTTEELMPNEAPGFFFNPCAINHLFIFLGSVIQELELHKYGLEYLPCDPVAFCPHPDGKYFLAHKSVEKTCAEIARYSERDAQKYAEYIEFWQHFVNSVTPFFNAPPKSLVDIAGNYSLQNIKDLFSLVGGTNTTLDLLRTLLNTPIDNINEYFDSEFLKAPLARLSAELSSPPSQKAMSFGAMMLLLRHNPGMARPRGGTGGLVEALVKMVQSHGGVILTDNKVEKVLVREVKSRRRKTWLNQGF